MSEISTGTLISSLETGCPDNITIKAIRAALLERDSLVTKCQHLSTSVDNLGQALDALKDKYLTATDNLKSREAGVAELTDRHHIDLMELDAQMKTVAAANQNAAKLATELNNLKESTTFRAYYELRLRLHDALRERDEWRDKAMEKSRRIECECPNCHAQLSVIGVVVAAEEGK